MVIEPYIARPEVDANLVLLDGQVVYFDLEDDVLTKGDVADAGMDDNFQEAQVLLPPMLPKDEAQLLYESLRRSIRRQGFTSGVFRYVPFLSFHHALHGAGWDTRHAKKERNGEGKEYLRPRNQHTPTRVSRIRRRQANSRCGLLRITHPSMHRFYRERSSTCAVQTFLERPAISSLHVDYSASTSSVMRTGDAGTDLLRRNPELRQHVPDYDTYLKRGDILEALSARSLVWVADFSVISRTSRIRLSTSSAIY